MYGLINKKYTIYQLFEYTNSYPIRIENKQEQYNELRHLIFQKEVIRADIALETLLRAIIYCINVYGYDTQDVDNLNLFSDGKINFLEFKKHNEDQFQKWKGDATKTRRPCIDLDKESIDAKYPNRLENLENQYDELRSLIYQKKPIQANIALETLLITISWVDCDNLGLNDCYDGDGEDRMFCHEYGINFREFTMYNKVKYLEWKIDKYIPNSKDEEADEEALLAIRFAKYKEETESVELNWLRHLEEEKQVKKDKLSEDNGKAKTRAK